jgi:hypothetical protein
MGIWRWQDYLLLFGIWIAASPWVLGFADEVGPGMWNAVLVGLAICALAIIDLDLPSKADEWAMIALGAWSMVSPWVLDLAGHRLAMTSMLVSGIAVVALTAWELMADAWRKPKDPVHSH